MTSSKPQDPFFKSLGSLAEDTDQLPDSDDEKAEDAVKNADGTTADEAEDDRPMQEIESLCMHCGEQVSINGEHLAGRAQGCMLI